MERTGPADSASAVLVLKGNEAEINGGVSAVLLQTSP